MATPLGKTPRISSASYTSSFRNIKLNIPSKKLISDNSRNNAEAVKRFYDKIDLKTELHKVIYDRNTCFIFREWLTEMECVENIDFWIEVELYKRENMDQETRLLTAKYIFEKYFNSDRDIQLNIDFDLKKLLEERLEQELDSSTFDEVQISVLCLLETSCCARFLRSDKYKKRVTALTESTQSNSLRRGSSVSSFWRKQQRGKSLCESVINTVLKWNDEIQNFDRLFAIIKEDADSPGIPASISSSSSFDSSISSLTLSAPISAIEPIITPILERKDSGKSRLSM